MYQRIILLPLPRSSGKSVPSDMTMIERSHVLFGELGIKVVRYSLQDHPKMPRPALHRSINNILQFKNFIAN